MEKELVIKYLNNRCTEEELQQIIQWVRSESGNEQSITWGLEDWDSFRVKKDYSTDDERFSMLFDKIQNQIDRRNPPKEIVLNKERANPIFSKIVTWTTRAAAILLIPALSILFYTLTKVELASTSSAQLAVDSMEIVAPIGSRAIVQLPDGSKVHLNYGSKIKYPQTFTGDTREVLLTGEAYFDVTHNPGKPFIVNTGQLDIRVLGTIFNVLAYPNENIIETTLVEGKVVLTQTNDDGELKSIGAMTPGQHVDYNIETGEISSTVGDIEKYISWREGKLIFEDTPINQVINKLNHMFNVEITVDDDVKDYRYTVTFVDEPLFQILDLMTIATPINYKALPREKAPNGTFSKQKIIIKRKS